MFLIHQQLTWKLYQVCNSVLSPHTHFHIHLRQPSESYRTWRSMKAALAAMANSHETTSVMWTAILFTQEQHRLEMWFREMSVWATRNHPGHDRYLQFKYRLKSLVITKITFSSEHWAKISILVNHKEEKEEPARIFIGHRFGAGPKVFFLTTISAKGTICGFS